MTPGTKTQVSEIASDLAYDGFFKIHKLSFRIQKFDGTLSDVAHRELFERGQAVAILPYDPGCDRVVLIRQFLVGAHMAGVDNRPIQAVAGMIEPGEAPEDVAVRELEEESGIGRVMKLIPAQNFLPSPGGSSERIMTYLGQVDLTEAFPGAIAGLKSQDKVVSLGTFGLDEENEDILVEAWDARAAIAAFDAGEIEAGPAVVLLGWFARRHRELYRNLEPAKRIRYSGDPKRPRVDRVPKSAPAYGLEAANSVVYMTERFRDFDNLGLIKASGHAEHIGTKVDGVSLCGFHGCRNSLTVQSDCEQIEKEQIAAGRTAVLVFYGNDNTSYMRRITPDEYDNLVITEYIHQDDDLYYNS